jgi:hypothetical protein
METDVYAKAQVCKHGRHGRCVEVSVDEWLCQHRDMVDMEGVEVCRHICRLADM